MFKQPLYDDSSWPVRVDIVDAHAQWLDHVSAPGTWWTGEERVAFVTALWSAIDSTDERPPWDALVPPHGWPLPRAAHAIANRLGRFASTTSESWYRRSLEGLGAGGAPAFVELVALAAMGCAVAAFGPALGIDRPTLPAPHPGNPTHVTPKLADAAMNWVPVVPPADERAAVVQAFTAVPAEAEMLWRLAAAQYMPLDAMAHMDWQRDGSPLHRRQLELVAARLSVRRQCFY